MISPEIIITADGSHTLLHPILKTTYHSIHGALKESQVVFIENGLHVLNKTGNPLSVFEFGFGTGLNAWLSLEFALTEKQAIEYTVIEIDPITESTWSQLNYPNIHPFPNGKYHFDQLHHAQWNQRSILSDSFNIEKRKLDWIEFKTSSKFDLIYFDAFAPESQAELWLEDSLKKLYDLLKPGGLLLTYCAKGIFKRRLKSVGFQVESLKGPPGKREITRAIK
ncbi:MAG: tRNA (5-methylaminomethyl-2-thiouridine)(34)-methyltransferase MnmD [Saprospiraceae bacterium]|nr:tRNA (5-methylaminomethyl-2-thiouridine)(34)-methyltransferase MnmD [Candidatus Defluviibacterium haderslevense]MBK7243727.1 tRNA (5-methylaminomethyl-2-thiouridine)(34)-methyltransferase MnmD [Candidatus Defluviibacterium haderslevense]